ncbi:zinc and ring finger 4 [Perkinsus chesapeaki]|uniref:Zinc and ring finger 4 n=2 Tax=Alveolata TaxID=33630 RepID=A7YXM5_PERCH|nr:zinc and ring finger 4-like protein [Perkinsus chesapeaki]KAF4654686.1 zinc and ring finger 4 [Perkinsus chesapeaki]
MSTVSRTTRLVAYTLSVVVVVAVGLAVVISVNQLGVSWPLLALFGVGPAVLIIILIIITLGATNFVRRKKRSPIRPTCIQQEVSFAKESGICPICIDTYGKEENVIILDCSHVYHCHCFNIWFTYTANSGRSFFCPVCRVAVEK